MDPNAKTQIIKGVNEKQVWQLNTLELGNMENWVEPHVGRELEFDHHWVDYI